MARCDQLIRDLQRFWQSGERARWIGSVYVRRQQYLEKPDALCIANITISPRGRGTLTAVLDTLEQVMPIEFECILNERLLAYLARRGYTGDSNRMRHDHY